MIDTQLYKTLLETEKDELINDLGSISIKDPTTGNYLTKSDTTETEADDSDLDDRNEEFEGDSAMTETLSLRLKDVEDALSKIQNNTYGICEVCKNEIEKERLQANPSARNCIADMNS